VYKVSATQLTDVLNTLAGTMDVFLPIRKDGQTNFGLYAEGVQADFDTLKTVKPPKEFFLPQSESLYKGVVDGKDIHIEPAAFADRPFVVFGMRGCDVLGMEILDKVYLGEPVDRFYEARRGHGCVVALACGRPASTCFCKPFGVDASDPQADVTAWLCGQYLYLEPVTERGRQLTHKLEPFLQDADAEDVAEYRQEIRERLEALPYNNLSLDALKDADMLEVFNSPVWDSVCDACIACGTCSYVCPTCQCYDIKDYNTGDGAIRYRTWDSCMYSDFTLMAHGNPRKTQKERFRQRFMHKLVYHPSTAGGQLSCVGCGRCVNKCPSSLNIVKIMKSLGVS